MSRTKMRALLLILLELSPFDAFYVYSCLLCNLNTPWNIIVILHSYVEQVMTVCRIQRRTTLAFVLSELFPLLWFQMHIPVRSLNTLWNIIMILYSYVEQIMTTCLVQEGVLSLSYFLSYFPLIVLDAASCPLCNLNTL